MVSAMMGFAFFFPVFCLPCSWGTGETLFFGWSFVQSGRAIPFFAIFHHLFNSLPHLIVAYS
jgi:hypothetical protein